MEDSRHIRVLIIEDDEFITMVYQDQLGEASNINFEVDAYTLFNEGIAAIEKGAYDVLLLDLNLPDSDYRNTIDKLSTFSHLLPVIIMTSTNDEHLALKAMNMGGQDYLHKSNLDKNLLIRSILYGIERHQLRNQLQLEKEKSDKLLRNILPESIADELKAKGKIEARHYEEVSVMFVDFVGFTSLTASMKPEELVQELHTCFSHFDSITERLGLEKIKTIGDAYMCAGGIPNESETHVENIAAAAFEIMEYIEKRYGEKLTLGQEYWRARIGIHLGPTIAGVVGSRKFTYDIWGDTVNTAARLETNSIPGSINISRSFYDQLKSNTAYRFEDRGEIDVKGKGRIAMFFIDKSGKVD
jgi:class 3 adenylate cyclase